MPLYRASVAEFVPSKPVQPGSAFVNGMNVPGLGGMLADSKPRF